MFFEIQCGNDKDGTWGKIRTRGNDKKLCFLFQCKECFVKSSENKYKKSVWCIFVFQEWFFYDKITTIERI